MYHGDRSRKEVLRRLRVSACRPRSTTAVELRGVAEAGRAVLLRVGDAGPYELRESGGAVVEQIIRPTG
jgi:excinuclease UvrABC helicase subunit UvrB